MPGSRPTSRTLLLVLAILAPLMAGVAPAAAQSDAVTVELERFGVGNRFRPADFVAIEVLLTSSLDEPTTAWIQWEIPNVDGDIAEYGRAVTLTPGQRTPLWLTAPLPPTTEPSTTWPIRVFRLEDGRRRGEIGGARINAADANALEIQLDESMIAIVGTTSDLGLRGYGPSSALAGGRPLWSNEVTQLVGGLAVTGLPDRWEGLRVFEAIVWAGATPQELRESQARALVEYVRRGGHLVVVLPEAGDPWSLGTPGRVPPALEAVLPSRAPRRDVDVPIGDVLPTLTKSRGVDREVYAPDALRLTLHVFQELGTEFDVIGDHYEPLVGLPDGRIIGIRRNVGHGWVTVLGIDVSNGQLLSTPLASGSFGVPQADVLWNRVLGRRADAPVGTEIQAIADTDRLVQGRSRLNDMGSGKLITQRIVLTGAAAIGLFLATGLFIVYWVVAGPGAYVVLRQAGKHQYSWGAFALAAVVFTVVAWLIVVGLRPSERKVRHFTVLDHVYRPDGDRGAADPQQQRAATWFSLFLPGYGKTPVTIEGDPEDRDLLATFIPPRAPLQPFPDVDRYAVNMGSGPARLDRLVEAEAAAFALPTRATSTMLYAHWLGGLDQAWGGMISVDPTDPVRVVDDPSGRESHLTGTLVHDLPDALERVTIIWVTNRRTTPRRYARDNQGELPWVAQQESGKILNNAYTWSLSGRWAPGTAVSLEVEELRDGVGTSLRLERNFEQTFFEPYADRGTDVSGPSRQEALDYPIMLSFFHQLQPPIYLRDEGGPSPDSAMLAREIAREIDLSTWLSRPCLIVLGWVRSPMPVPLRVDGRPPQTDGDSFTLVRWIHPLEVDAEAIVESAVAPGDAPPPSAARGRTPPPGRRPAVGP